MQLSSFILASMVIVTACSSKSIDDRGTTAHHPNPLTAIGECSRALEAMLGEPIQNKESVIMTGCKELHARKSCREAWERRINRESVGIEQVVISCSSAYCDDLQTPRPDACVALPDDSRQLRPLWPPLSDAIIAYELGHHTGEASTNAMLERFSYAPWKLAADSSRLDQCGAARRLPRACARVARYRAESCVEAGADDVHTTAPARR